MNDIFLRGTFFVQYWKVLNITNNNSNVFERRL